MVGICTSWCWSIAYTGVQQVATPPSAFEFGVSYAAHTAVTQSLY